MCFLQSARESGVERRDVVSARAVGAVPHATQPRIPARGRGRRAYEHVLVEVDDRENGRPTLVHDGRWREMEAR